MSTMNKENQQAKDIENTDNTLKKLYYTTIVVPTQDGKLLSLRSHSVGVVSRFIRPTFQLYYGGSAVKWKYKLTITLLSCRFVILRSVVFIHFGLFTIVVCQDCYDNVPSCPKGQTAWERRRHEYNCTAAGREYVCMMISNGSLAEACMMRYLVGVKEGKCPYIEKCHSPNGPVLRMNSYRDCMYEGPECPGKDGVKEIYVQDIYKYPACTGRKTIVFNDVPSGGNQAVTSNVWIAISIMFSHMYSSGCLK